MAFNASLLRGSFEFTTERFAHKAACKALVKAQRFSGQSYFRLFDKLFRSTSLDFSILFLPRERKNPSEDKFSTINSSALITHTSHFTLSCSRSLPVSFFTMTRRMCFLRKAANLHSLSLTFESVSSDVWINDFM